MDFEISIAIPFYRNLPLLKEAVESALHQSVVCPILICDDSLTGEAEAWASSLPTDRVHYHRNPTNLGMVDNWNQCVKKTQTPYVTLLHADDRILPNYIDLMKQGWKRHPEASVLFCRAQIIDEKGKPRFSFPDWYKEWLLPHRTEPLALRGETGLRYLLKGNFLFCPSACFKKSSFSAFDPRWKMVQDLDRWANRLLSGETLVHLPQTGYEYRRHASNSTAVYTQSLQRFHEELALYKELAERLTDRGWAQAAKTAGKAHILKLNLLYCAVKDLIRFQWDEAFKKGGLLWSACRPLLR